MKYPDSCIIKLQSHHPSRRPISEFLAPETKTVIEYDCMPTVANILAASIADMNENRIVKSFGIQKGFEPGTFKQYISSAARNMAPVTGLLK